MEIGLSLGSNIDDRLLNLSRAGRLISAIPGISFEARSPVYETEPVGVSREFADLAFLNSMLIVETRLAVGDLVGIFRSVEIEMGRLRAPRNSPRLIDIDVVYANGMRVETTDAVIPHPRWFERRFVVQPLSDVRPDLHIPGQAGSVMDVLLRLADKSSVVRFADDW